MNAVELKYSSIADIPEDKLVERLLSDPLWATEMFELSGNPDGTLKKARVPPSEGVPRRRGHHSLLSWAS